MKVIKGDIVSVRFSVVRQYADGSVELDTCGLSVAIADGKSMLMIPHEAIDEVMTLRFKVGDRVRQKKSFDNKPGTILAIHGSKAWVRMDLPTINEPRTWRLDSMERAE